MKAWRKKKARLNAAKAGYTLTEVVVATSIGAVVTAAVMSTYIWCGKQVYTSTKMSWSQREATATANKLTAYLRNAEEIVSIDEVEGTWVELRFTDGSLATLVYSNAVSLLRDGRMYLHRNNREELLVARGLTEIQSANGYTTPVFVKTRGNNLRVSYRVSEPVKSGWRDADDGTYASAVQFSACLRNALPTEDTVSAGEG